MADSNSNLVTNGMTGAELKALRKQLGLSLAQAARQGEVSTRSWARWEAGDQDIPAGALKLFRILNHLTPLPPRTIRLTVTEQTVATAPEVRDFSEGDAVKTPTNLDFFISGDRWKEKLAAVKVAIIECEPLQALELLDAMIADLDPERDTAQTN